MTRLNGGQRDELHPNRQVSKEVLNERDYPNLPLAALTLAREDMDAFNEAYPLKLRSWKGSGPGSAGGR